MVLPPNALQPRNLRFTYADLVADDDLIVHITNVEEVHPPDAFSDNFRYFNLTPNSAVYFSRPSRFFIYERAEVHVSWNIEFPCQRSVDNFFLQNSQAAVDDTLEGYEESPDGEDVLR